MLFCDFLLKKQGHTQHNALWLITSHHADFPKIKIPLHRRNYFAGHGMAHVVVLPAASTRL